MNKFLYKIRTPKNQLRHVKLTCKHEDQWPPAEMYLDDNPERLRQQERITELVYESIKVWRDKCGKKEMDEKCTECELSSAKVKVRTPGKGRYQEKQVSFAEFNKTSRTDMHLIYEIGVLEDEEEDKSLLDYTGVDKSLLDSDVTGVTIVEVTSSKVEDLEKEEKVPEPVFEETPSKVEDPEKEEKVPEPVAEEDEDEDNDLSSILEDL